MSEGSTHKARGPSMALVVTAAGLAAALAIAAVYFNDAPADNGSTSPGPAGGVATAATKPAGQPTTTGQSEGSLAAFVFKKDRPPVADIAFTDAEGRPMTLAAFKGKTVLLNLWATWCAPCRKEMPDLDRLQRDMGSDSFEVVALSLDRGGVAASKAFLDKIGVTNLKLYVDDTGRASAPLKIIGMPTTLLIDAEGREIGRLVGPAPWDGEPAKKLIEAQLR